MVNRYANVSDMLGATLSRVHQDGDEEITFETNDGRRFVMFHEQDCCENVTIDDVVGDLQSLVGNPILVAEEVSSDDEEFEAKNYAESFTWTFYKFATIKGHVDIKWFGSSNGYYSEGVSFRQTA
ncbi:hypothetical protein NKH33_09640 [Mesorhizobium sp. M1182]|uniref:DUF7448 domain-containing protein n=1 Tax=unclassified Mesorhizobium TaxID=325217 RepID=UPI003339743F